MAIYPRKKPHINNPQVSKYKHVYLPLWGFGGVETIAVDEGGSTSHAIEDILQSAGAGNPSFGEVGSLGICGLHIDAAGDDIRVLFPVPDDLDPKYDISFRVWWSSASTTGTDGVTWKVLYSEITPDSDALSAPSTALSTAIAEDTNDSTANVLQVTEWGTLDAGTISNGNALSLLVELDATDVTLGSEATYGYYLEIRYTRRIL